ncbi:nephrin-like protein [Leptotrombidium deliense]|uniref:Nephrin-like protein n=1 Tax=Leptotrombidium deliense TaxID=299467 RepID=A0A443SSG7_9ACAR|nr:nephrin-like protein [Leptotrombidium deliense]
MVFTNIGDEAVITCEAIGNPINDEMIVWRRNDSLQNLSNSNRKIAIRNEKGKSILNISRVNNLDLGFYKCVAFNGIGHSSEALINLLLKQKPVITDTNIFAAANEHESLVIKCTARGVPLVKFSWFNSDGDLFLSSREDSSKERKEKRSELYSVSSHQLTDFKFQSWLTIRKVSANDFGSAFKCSAFNALGRDSIEITVREKGRPEPPQNVTLTSIDHDSVTISLIPGFDGGVQQTFRAKYQKVAANPEQDHYQITEESNSTRITIDGLQQATEYVLTVISKNEFGESKFASNSLIFTTKFADASSDGSPLIDTFSDVQSKSLSKIAVMIAVIALGLVIALTNCAFIFIYIKRKKKKEEQKNVQYCENSNGVVANNQNQIHSETHHCKSLENVDLTRTDFNECHLSAEMNAQQFEFITGSLIIENDVNGGSKHCKVVSFHEDVVDNECGCYLKTVGNTSF